MGKHDLDDVHICGIHPESIYSTSMFLTRRPTAMSSVRMRIHRKFQELSLASPKHYMVKKLMHSEKAINMEQQRQLTMKNSFMLHPYSEFVLIWRHLIFIVLLSICFLAPAATFLKHGEGQILITMIFCSDFLAFFDILVKFFTGAHHKRLSEVIFDLPHSAREYIKTDFVFNFIGFLPIQYILYIAKYKMVLDLAFFLKCFHLKCVMIYFETICRQANLDFKWIYRIKIILKTMMLVHWTASLYNHLACMYVESYAEDMSGRGSWVIYCLSLYFVTGVMSSSGQSYMVYEDYDYEMMSAGVMIIGCLFQIYVIMKVITAIEMMFADMLAFGDKLNEVKCFVNDKRLPRTLRNKIYMFMNGKSSMLNLNEKKILSELNDHLRKEIKMYKCEKSLTRVPIFKGIPIITLVQIVDYLVQDIYMPGDYIVKSGQKNSSMFFLVTGLIAVEDASGTELVHLDDGDYFSEESLLIENTESDKSYLALEICDIYCLKFEDWGKITKQFPELIKEFEKMIYKKK